MLGSELFGYRKGVFTRGQVLEQTVGPVPADKQKNDIRSRYGKIEVAVGHAFSRPVLGSRTSSYLQEKQALLSMLTVFGQVPELVEQLLGLRVNQSQVYRQYQRIADVLDEQQLRMPSLSPALAGQ